MKLKNINLFEGRIGSICCGFDDSVLDLVFEVEKIDDGLLVDFADFGVDSVLQSIEGLCEKISPTDTELT